MTITFNDIKIVDSICTGVAFIFTITRLVLRVQSGRIWWDDAILVLSALFLLITCVAIAVHYGKPYEFNLPARLAAYYFIAEGFYVTLWTARLSILYSIIRIVPDKNLRRFLYYSAIAFTAVLLFLIAQVFWVCESSKKAAWKTRPNPQCPLGFQVAICQLVTDIVSDLLLIIIPIRLLWRTNLERTLKIRLFVIFGAAILTTVVSLVHAAYILEVRGVDAITSAIVEISVAIIVSNLVVVVPALSRALGSRLDKDPRHRALPTTSLRFANSLHFERSEPGTTGTTGSFLVSQTAPSADTGTSTAMTSTAVTATGAVSVQARDA